MVPAPRGHRLWAPRSHWQQKRFLLVSTHSFSKGNTMHWGGIKECLAIVCHLLMVDICGCVLCLCVRVHTGVWKCEISRKKDSWLRWYPCKREERKKNTVSGKWQLWTLHVCVQRRTGEEDGLLGTLPLVQVFSLNYSYDILSYSNIQIYAYRHLHSHPLCFTFVLYAWTPAQTHVGMM